MRHRERAHCAPVPPAPTRTMLSMRWAGSKRAGIAILLTLVSSPHVFERFPQRHVVLDQVADGIHARAALFHLHEHLAHVLWVLAALAADAVIAESAAQQQTPILVQVISSQA